MDLNTVTITGRLTANPELRYTNDGKAVTNMRVAVNDRTDFVDVTVWRKPAEAVAERKAKGDQIGGVDVRVDHAARITSKPWSHSLPTIWPSFEPSPAEITEADAYNRNDHRTRVRLAT